MIKKISPAQSLRGSITPPSDKSISQRAAIFSLLHEGSSVIKNYSEAEDPQSTLSCIEQLGAKVDRWGDKLQITGTGRNGIQRPYEDLDCGNSGTAMRLLSGVLAGSGVQAKLCGDESLSNRTMKRIIEPLESMGAHILARNSEFAPLMVSRNEPLRAIDYTLPIPSAQLKSCILLAGLFGKEPTRVVETVPSRDHTERILGLKQQKIEGETYIYSSLDDEIPAQNYTVPGDFSAASFWIVAGSVIPGSEILIRNVGLNPSRTALLNILRRMGANIEIGNQRTEGSEPVGDLVIRSASLTGTRIEQDIIPNCIDELPILSVAMLFAKGESIIMGAGELRHKETDRLMAIGEMLDSASATYQEYEEGIIIKGSPDHKYRSGLFKGFSDHRIIMASAILALKANKESHVMDYEKAAVSYPGFFEDLASLSVAGS
ncbi:3-phosphoshikimate 1-carboxyvinyltransferase [Balneola sp. MJW-20]|uniref:3-phosphoshikimate 1-carboxyvinyltransferase n=1 Tax=Gracilimonas aurantiaca TaxID=3234185 RepID=UPI003466971C